MTTSLKHILFTSILALSLAGCDSSSDKPTSDHGLIEHNTTTVETNTTNDDHNTTSDQDNTGGTDTNGTTGGGSNDQNNTGGSDNNGSTGGQDDNSTTGSTEQNGTGGSTGGGTDTNTTTLKSLALSIQDTSLNKDHNTTLQVKATYSDGKSADVTDQVEWVMDTPDALTIHDHTLTALKDRNVTLRAKLSGTLSNPVALNIYWEVNGHRLPPEPDPAVNNATLLGVDVNHNGVRDDVERKVYATYKKAIERAVMMQAFRTEQAMLADPDLVKNAREWAKKEDKVIDCNEYLKFYKNQKRIRGIYKFVNNAQYNTKERVKKFYDYDQALSGGVYSIGKPVLQNCEFDVEKVLEMDR